MGSPMRRPKRSLDDLISAAENCLRHRQTKLVRRLQIKDHFEDCRLNDRQIGRVLTAEDLTDI